MNKLALLLLFVFYGLSVKAEILTQSERDFLTIDKVEINAIDDDLPPWRRGETTGNSQDPIGQARNVIAAGRDLVALGEEFYKLVEKGRPISNTKCEPISVLPKDENGMPVDELATAY